MNSHEIIKEYLRLSDIMYQALKADKYPIFENALKERGNLVSIAGEDQYIFSEIEKSLIEKWKVRLINADKLVESEMDAYKKKQEMKLSRIQAAKARTRTQSKALNYHGKTLGNQGMFINKLK